MHLQCTRAGLIMTNRRHSPRQLSPFVASHLSGGCGGGLDLGKLNPTLSTSPGQPINKRPPKTNERYINMPEKKNGGKESTALNANCRVRNEPSAEQKVRKSETASEVNYKCPIRKLTRPGCPGAEVLFDAIKNASGRSERKSSKTAH